MVFIPYTVYTVYLYLYKYWFRAGSPWLIMICDVYCDDSSISFMDSCEM